MKNFYFTYGSIGYPFKGGWTRVRCESLDIAIQVFKIYHPNRKGRSCLNCADFYTEEQFMNSRMFRDGNFGEFCHEFIDLYRGVIDEEDENEK